MEKQVSQILALVSSLSSDPPTESALAELGSSTPLPSGPSGWDAKAYRTIHLDPSNNPGLRSVLPLVQKSGVSKGQLEAVLAGIPGKRLSDALINFYFEHIKSALHGPPVPR